MKTTRFPLTNSNKHFVRYGISITLLIVIFLLNSCATTTILLSEGYQNKIEKSYQKERTIDKVILYQGRYGLHREPQNWFSDCNSVNTSTKSMGENYTVLGENVKERHREEPILDSLFKIAKEEYPNDKVDIRNASSAYKYLQFLGLGGGCQKVYFADVVTTEPMPKPVEYSKEISLEGVTRDDVFRKIHNWFDDRKYSEDKKDKGVRMEKLDGIQIGRIKGDFIFYTPNQRYMIIAPFTVDVLDEKTKISFANTSNNPITMVRAYYSGDKSIEDKGGPIKGEPIFLQSIANLLKAELIKFSEELISGIK
jgi:hypothetical protein